MTIGFLTGPLASSEYVEYAPSFNQALNKWDVSKVTHMWGVFATSFNQPLHAPWYHE